MRLINKESFEKWSQCLTGFECFHCLDKLHVLFGYQKESKNVRMKAKYSLVRWLFFPEIYMVSLSWILRSHFLQPLLLTSLSLREQVCPASELTLAKGNSNHKPYCHQKERFWLFPTSPFYLLKVCPTPAVMLQPHQLPSCSLNLAHFTDPQDIWLAVPEPGKLFSTILLTRSHPSAQSSKENFPWKL